MLIPSAAPSEVMLTTSLSRRVNANSQLYYKYQANGFKLIKKGEC